MCQELLSRVEVGFGRPVVLAKLQTAGHFVNWQVVIWPKPQSLSSSWKISTHLMFVVVAFHHLTIMFLVSLKVRHCYCHCPLTDSISSCWQLDIDLLCCDPLTITTTISVLNHGMGRLSTIASTINCPTLLTRFRQVLSRHSRDPVLILWSSLPSALGPMVFSHHFTFCILR